MTALKEKLSDDEIKPNNLALVGRSAGAHLALLYGYTRNNPLALSYGINDDSPIDVKLIVADVGPTDATAAADFFVDTMWTDIPGRAHALLSCLLGAEVPVTDWNAIPVNILELLEKVSPVSYVTEYSPPTLLRYTENDNMVPASQGDKLKDKLEDCYNKVEDVDFNLFPFKESPHRLDFDGIPSGISDEELERYQDYWAKYDWYFDEYMIEDPED